MWNFTFMTMEAKAFQTTSWEIIHSLPWEHHKRCIFIKFMDWPQMEAVKPRVSRWKKPNLMCNVVKKMSRSYNMIEWLDIMQRAMPMNPSICMISCKHDNNISPPNIDDGHVYEFSSHCFGGFILTYLFLQCNVHQLCQKYL